MISCSDIALCAAEFVLFLQAFLSKHFCVCFDDGRIDALFGCTPKSLDTSSDGLHFHMKKSKQQQINRMNVETCACTMQIVQSQVVCSCIFGLIQLDRIN